MAAEAKHREAIVAAAASLFRQRGYGATGMNDIVAESGAPKGSIYHYFPEGKGQIGAAALALSGRVNEARMVRAAGATQDPAAFFQAIVTGMADALAQSGFRNGCPVAALVLDTPPDDTRIMGAAEQALASWRLVATQVCLRAGLAADRAAFVASVAISAFEGALMQARAARNVAPLQAAGEAMAVIMTAELARLRSGAMS
jgi:TetR/AcrR family transcriptional repressor of lmrAB and yxaGH operons